MSYAQDLKEAAAAKPVEQPGKTYPQFNEDGTPKLGEDGLQLWGPEKFKGKKKAAKVVEYEKNEDGTDKLDEAGNKIPVKKAKKVKEVEYEKNEDGTDKLDEAGNKIPVKKARSSRSRAISLECGGKPFDLHANQNETKLEVVGNVMSKEGSKRSERAKAYTGATTVQEFYINKGAPRDLARHLKSGAVKLTFGGKPVTVAGAVQPA